MLRNPNAALLRAQVQTFIRAFGLLRDAETPCGKPLPISQAQALMVLLERESAIATTRQKDLAEALGLDKSSVARLCRRLDQTGRVIQRRSARDARARELVLTTKGKRLATEIGDASRARFAQVMAAIPRANRPHVLHALAVLNGAIATLAKEKGPEP